MTVRAIVTDIEGTTSSIAFVHDVLFPYARARLAAFVAANAARLGDELEQVRQETHAPALDLHAAIAQLLDWHDADRKVAPLKAIQGKIWAEGYADGSLTGHLYPDAIAGLRRWHAQGVALYVYSSGSIAAQKLLFSHTAAGDLTPLFTGYFDTTIGGKRDSGSYAEIARRLAMPGTDILFLSDVAAELAAARQAGLAVLLVARDKLPEESAYPVVTSFDTIFPEKAPA
ncbi:acireductone synthase [Sphingomonas sp. CARO-RG-8B-R24-01]|uniref:acireductone synthase n=1 Tax=Sphingomonas sp. CARO-RG-8B-R24-01 TaxID=2914831 RepID=UPI001F57E08C|nr:acireductone synthase [Sphingomonas sp. CARO-RG-8B-R24-01]